MGITSLVSASSCTTTDARKEARHPIQVQLPDLNRHTTDRNRFCPLRLSVYQFAGPRASAIPPPAILPPNWHLVRLLRRQPPPPRDPTGGWAGGSVSGLIVVPLPPSGVSAPPFVKTVLGQCLARTPGAPSYIRHGRLSLRRLQNPESMSPADRCREVASLLAAGFVRLRLKRADLENKGLDVLRTSSHSCLEPSSEEREET